jgi:protein O-mannosyl-transferase
VLSTFFLMLTFWAYAIYARTERGVGRKIAAYLVVVLLYACGLMSKQMLVSAPILFLLLDYWPLNRLFLNLNPNLALNFRRVPSLLAEKILFLLMAIGASIAVVVAQGSGGAISQRIPLAARISNAIVTYIIYAADMFWPHDLAHYYPHEAYHWVAFDVFGSVALLVLITAGALWMARSRPYLLVGWLWYLVTLLPVIGLVQVGGQARADRYTYIPSIGIFIMVAFGAADLLKKLLAREISTGGRRTIQIGTAVLAVAATTSLAVVAHKQVGYWKSGETLCKHTLAVTRNNWFVHSALAAILNTQADVLRANGKSVEAKQKNEEAVEHLKSTLAIMPSMANAHVILANAFLKLDRLSEASEAYRRALALEPNNALAHSNLANCLKQQGKLSDALIEYAAAIRCAPTYADTHYNYGLALHQSGRADDALREFQTTLQCYPSDLAAYWTEHQMAEILSSAGKKNEALALLRNAVEINERSHVDPGQNAARTMLERLEKTP